MLAGGDGVAGKNAVVVKPLSDGPDIGAVIVVTTPLACELAVVDGGVVGPTPVPGDGVLTTGAGVVGG